MYANEEDLPLISSSKVPIRKKGIAWKFVLGSIALSTIALLVLSLNGGMSKSTYSSAIEVALAEKRMKMSKEGTLHYSSLNEGEKKQLFAEFVGNYEKKYENEEEEARRYGHFVEHLKNVDKHNLMERQNEGGAVHGLTVFADMSLEEFCASKLGSRAVSKEVHSNEVQGAPKKTAPEHKYNGTDTFRDWSGILTTPVKDQGLCGACWAISSVEQIESDSIRMNLITKDQHLSIQQLVSCDSLAYGVSPYFSNDGCQGGFTETAFAYIFYEGGLNLETNYPYARSTYMDIPIECDTQKNDYKVTLTNFYEMKDETSMADHILSTGPLSICIDGSTWQTYTSGIMSGVGCGREINHCVQIVGVNKDEGYWIVRNSWGTQWGYDGHLYLKMGVNACNVAFSATYVDPIAYYKAGETLKI
mmetsp:Transcript_10899/g.10520  ORF Transcript_10899/g.10520 Transcript_10899/m.10520 type:complete len:417 (-) Transcript_10899:76-1326(-)